MKRILPNRVEALHDVSGDDRRIPYPPMNAETDAQADIVGGYWIGARVAEEGAEIPNDLSFFRTVSRTGEWRHAASRIAVQSLRSFLFPRP